MVPLITTLSNTLIGQFLFDILHQCHDLLVGLVATNGQCLAQFLAQLRNWQPFRGRGRRKYPASAQTFCTPSGT